MIITIPWLKKHLKTSAKENEIITAGKKDSQGLCFIGKVKLPDFLQQKLKPKIYIDTKLNLIDQQFLLKCHQK